jgi:hypothetical protein
MELCECASGAHYESQTLQLYMNPTHIYTAYFPEN